MGYFISFYIAGAGKAGQFGQKDKKPTTPSALSSAAKLEHALVLQSLQECIGPRLSPEVSTVFHLVSCNLLTLVI